MALSKEDLKELLEAQQKMYVAAQQQMLETQKQLFEGLKLGDASAGGAIHTPKPALSTTEILIQALNTKLETFDYDPDSHRTFDVWYRRFETVFTEDGKDLSDENRVKLLCRKLSDAVFDRLEKIMPLESPHKAKFKEIIRILNNTFGLKETVFTLRYACLHIKKEAGEDILEFLDKALTFVTEPNSRICKSINSRV